MSETSTFTGEGFKPFPNTHSDNQRISELADPALWTDEMIENKLAEYYQFMDRPDIMRRARSIGERIIRHLSFEMDCRYDEEVVHE